jgi:HEAT repeat protein
VNRAIDRLVMQIDLLFQRSLVGGVEDETSWKAVTTLRGMGSRLVFDKAKSWTASQNPRKRLRAAQVLCQLRCYVPRGKSPIDHRKSREVCVDESFLLLRSMLKDETDNEVLLAIVYGLGHLRVPAAVPLVLPFAEHPSEEFRYAATFALGSFHDDPQAIVALTKLMGDPDREVRDWAIFGLGVLGAADSEELRKSFLARLDDPYFDARLEATAALAKRHDLRVLKPLIALLERYGDIYSLCEAADSLLKMDRPSPNWSAEEYIAALEAAFPE